MPRVSVPNFVGGSSTLKSRQINATRSVNLIVRGGGVGGKVAATLNNGMGVTPFSFVPGARSIRGLFAQDGRAFAVGGTSFVEFFEDGTTGPAITLLEDYFPATMVSNGQGGNQLLAVSGGTGIVYDLATNSQIPITAPNLDPPYTMAAYIDTYGLVVKAFSPKFQFSALNDFSNWVAFDFAARSEGPDNISAIVRNHRELWILGTLTSEVWYDDGVTPFAPIQGVFIEQGCIATFSALGLDNTVFWLGQNIQGQGQVFRANGYTPERISDEAVDFALAQSDQLRNTIAWSFQLQGHLFYGLYVPDLPTTWVYDVSTKIWAEWARWDISTATFIPWFARCSCHAFGRTLIGDRSSSTIYEVNFDLLDNEVAG